MRNITARKIRAAMLFAIAALCWFGLMGRSVGADIAPIISATLNGSAEGVLTPGHPGIFEIEITHPDLWEDAIEPIRLEQAGASWTNALKWSVQDAAGIAVAWPLSMLPVVSTTLVLDRDSVGRVFFLLSPESTLAFPLGTYSIDFALDTRPDAVAGAWLGMAQAVQIEIRVAAEAAQLTAAEIAHRQTQLARYHALRRNFTAALQALDVLLALQPRSQDGLRAKAAILQLSGNVKDALAVSDDALGFFTDDFPNAPEPPRDILELRSALTALAAAGLKVTSATIANGQLTIVWEAEAGKQYRVESSADFRTWRVDASALTAATWVGSVGPGTRFFRIVVE